jgi:hypothetical protein
VHGESIAPRIVSLERKGDGDVARDDVARAVSRSLAKLHCTSSDFVSCRSADFSAERSTSKTTLRTPEEAMTSLACASLRRTRERESGSPLISPWRSTASLERLGGHGSGDREGHGEERQRAGGQAAAAGHRELRRRHAPAIGIRTRFARLGSCAESTCETRQPAADQQPRPSTLRTRIRSLRATFRCAAVRAGAKKNPPRRPRFRGPARRAYRVETAGIEPASAVAPSRRLRA